MKKLALFLMMMVCLVGFKVNAMTFDYPPKPIKGWRAGVARVVITPEEPMWMSGYTSRDHTAEGKLHDLWAKALVIEDADGKRAVVISTDVRGIPKYISDRIRNRIKEKYKLSRDQVLLNSSHTHSGPVMFDTITNFVYLNPMEIQEREKLEQYSIALENKLLNLVGEALELMMPVQISSGNGVARFAVNRRNNNESTIRQQVELRGPIDHSVPVIKITKETEEVVAIIFGYACHPTVLNGYKWSGDYPGFAQLELEKSYPGVTALFLQGAGGDLNPMPRRSVPLARQYGLELAEAVKRVLKEEMNSQPPRLKTIYSEVDLSLEAPPTKQELAEVFKRSSGIEKLWAKRLLNKLDRGESLRISYPYPVQVWQLGDQLMVNLGGELVVEYANNIKQIFGQSTFVFGYSNDVMSYIPSATILREGGYEGASSQKVRGMASNWGSTIESRILQEVVELANQIQVPLR